MQEVVLAVKNLSKFFGNLLAVDNISFSLQKGEVLGLLGPNGAGKTTTIQMLLGLTTPSQGGISYFGQKFTYKSQDVYSRINFASTYSKLQGKITVYENLLIMAGLYKVQYPQKVIKELAQLLQITKLLNTVYTKLSSGQKTRVILAKSLINSPELILMDEPTASLDPDIVDSLIGIIIRLQQEKNISILFTSHNMGEVARICNRIIFLDHGKIIAEDSPLELTKKVGEASLQITFAGKQQPIINYLDAIAMNDFRFIRSQIVEIRVKEELIPKILFGLSKQQVWMTNIEINKPTLEDVFLNFVRHKNEL